MPMTLAYVRTPAYYINYTIIHRRDDNITSTSSHSYRISDLLSTTCHQHASSSQTEKELKQPCVGEAILWRTKNFVRAGGLCHKHCSRPFALTNSVCANVVVSRSKGKHGSCVVCHFVGTCGGFETLLRREKPRPSAVR
jgi:hypothetical protein